LNPQAEMRRDARLHKNVKAHQNQNKSFNEMSIDLYADFNEKLDDQARDFVTTKTAKVHRVQTVT
jgi:hypothetical protein